MTEAEVDWKDPQAILSHVIESGCVATPLMVERLLEHCGWEEIGALPSRNPWKVVVWGHRARDRHPALAKYQFIVHHPGQLGPPVLAPILQALSEALRVATTCGAGAPRLTFHRPPQPRTP